MLIAILSTSQLVPVTFVSTVLVGWLRVGHWFAAWVGGGIDCGWSDMIGGGQLAVEDLSVDQARWEDR